MQEHVTIRDVAAEAGVLVATVSRVMNGPSGVAPEHAEKVRSAVDRPLVTDRTSHPQEAVAPVEVTVTRALT